MLGLTVVCQIDLMYERWKSYELESDQVYRFDLRSYECKEITSLKYIYINILRSALRASQSASVDSAKKIFFF